MQFWPRKRTKKLVASVRSWAASKEPKILGFAGYKVGMTHLMITDNRAHTLTKGETISFPATIIECPPLKAASIRFYKNSYDGLKLVSEVVSEKLDKELARKIIMPKKITKKAEDVKDYDDIKLLVYTQPKLTGIGKKKPEMFEMAIGGKKEEKLKYAQEVLGKDICAKDVLKEGQQLDAHAITKGKGFQGPIKRFGIGLKSHKQEKGRRRPGSLGGWRGQGHVMYRVAHAGQMGYQQRTEYNKWLLKIGEKPEEINNKSGFNEYGVVRNTYLLIKGSLGGHVKRLVRFSNSIRADYKLPAEAPVISYTSK